MSTVVISSANVQSAQEMAQVRANANCPYVYGGTWDKFDPTIGCDCSAAVCDVLKATIVGAPNMNWDRNDFDGNDLSTEDWRPYSMGGGTDPNNGPFGTIMVDDPNEFPADAAVLIAFHHGPGGGENSHTWCSVGGFGVESNGSDGTVVGDDARSVYLVDSDTVYGANNWWYLPGPIEGSGLSWSLIWRYLQA